MKRLLFTGFPHTATYNRMGWTPWNRGEAREVGDADADALIADFGGAFVLDEQEPPPPAPEAPPAKPAKRSKG